MKRNMIEEINSIVDYEVYLSDKYDFVPLNYNEDMVWKQIIEKESRAKFSAWYKKFIKKYYSKKLLPKKHLRSALLIAGCEPNLVDVVIQKNDAKEIVHYFRKVKKKRKLKCFYACSMRENKTQIDNEMKHKIDDSNSAL